MVVVVVMFFDGGIFIFHFICMATDFLIFFFVSQILPRSNEPNVIYDVHSLFFFKKKYLFGLNMTNNDNKKKLSRRHHI